jgi:signal transduction histidine kinase
LRTPMNAILGFGQLLEGSTLSPDDSDSVQQILKAGSRLLALIDDLLDLSGIEANRLSFSIEPVSVNELVRESLDVVRPIAVERRVEIRVESLDPPGHVLADRERLKQVFLNLLSNAIKYNRDRDGMVVVSGHELPGQIGVIRVRDTGPGIPPEALDQLFAPFAGIEGLRAQVEGTGLGLAISKALTEAMGGRINVVNWPGQGATFSLEFPIAVQQPGVAELQALAEESPPATMGRS